MRDKGYCAMSAHCPCMSHEAGVEKAASFLASDRHLHADTYPSSNFSGWSFSFVIGAGLWSSYLTRTWHYMILGA